MLEPPPGWITATFSPVSQGSRRPPLPFPASARRYGRGWEQHASVSRERNRNFPSFADGLILRLKASFPPGSRIRESFARGCTPFDQTHATLGSGAQGACQSSRFDPRAIWLARPMQLQLSCGCNIAPAPPLSGRGSGHLGPAKGQSWLLGPTARLLVGRALRVVLVLMFTEPAREPCRCCSLCGRDFQEIRSRLQTRKRGGSSGR